MKALHTALVAIFRLLPVRVSENDLKGEGERTEQSVPANFAAVVLNGLFFPTAARVLSTGLVLTWFISDLTPSAFWVGLLVPVQQGLALVPQPVFAEWIAAKPRRAPYYAGQALLRTFVWAALGLAVWSLGSEHASILLALFFLVFAVDATCGGFGNIAFNDALASVIPQGLRGRVRGWRGVFGSVAASIAGLLIRYYFSARSEVAAFGTLFVAAGVLYALGGLVFALIDEPEKERASTTRPRLADLFRRMREMLRRVAFRRFVIAQALLIPLTQGLPFFTLFAKRAFGLELKTLGLLILVDAITPIVGNFVWGRLADARGNRWVMFAAALFGVLALVCGGVLYAIRGQGWSGAFVLLSFAVLVFASGTATIGIDLATKNYVLDLAPNAAERPIYIGVNDTLVGLPTILLIGTGFVIDTLGFAPVFTGIGALALGGALVARRLRSFENERPSSS